MLVKELMSASVEWVPPDMTVQEAARRMREKNIGALPVCQNGKLLGMVTDRDVCCRSVANGVDPKVTKVREIMSADAACCFDDQDMADAAHLMEQKHIRRLPVLDRKQAMVGFLSVDDIARRSHELAGEVMEKTAPHWH